MGEVTVVKQFTKFIFPFTYDKDKLNVEKICFTDKKGNKQNLFKTTSIKGTYLRDGLDLLLDANGGSTKIADCYLLSPNYRSYYDLPSNKGKPMTFYARNDQMQGYSVSMEDVCLYLFESGVGFVDIECVFPQCTLQSCETLNYFISEVKSEANVFKWEKTSRNAQTGELEKAEISFAVQQLLSRISRDVSADGEDGCLKYGYYTAKPLVYSYVLLSEKPDNMSELLFHLAKNYKDSYKFSGDAAVATLHPFDNAYWACSVNGAVNVSCLTGDATTDSFFTHDFVSKMHDTYFLLFINVTHQRYALEGMLGKMGQLDSIVSDFDIMQAQLKKAEAYEAEAHNLKFRVFFNHPSTIQHINDYYDTLKRVLAVNALYDSFSTDLANLQNICRKYVDRINAIERKLSRVRMIRAELLVSVFGCLVGEFSLLNTSWELIEKFAGHEVSFMSPEILLVMGTLTVPLVTIGLSCAKLTKEAGQIKRELKEENVGARKPRKRVKKVKDNKNSQS